MKVRSPLADMDIGIGEVRRKHNELVLKSGPGSSMDAVITVSAREVFHILRAVLSSPSGLVFVCGLPFFWLRQVFGWGETAGAAADSSARPADINKPW
jgi:hypothetical protein